MKVYVAGYKGTDTDDILGVFVDIEKAKESIHKDYESTEFGYVPDIKEIYDSHIYISKSGEWFDEWYIVETDLSGGLIMAAYAERVKTARNWNDCRIRDLIECMKSSKSNLEDFETLGRKASNKIDKCIAELERLRIAYKMEE